LKSIVRKTVFPDFVKPIKEINMEEGCFWKVEYINKIAARNDTNAINNEILIEFSVYGVKEISKMKKRSNAIKKNASICILSLKRKNVIRELFGDISIHLRISYVYSGRVNE
jgi:hypothetical protein